MTDKDIKSVAEGLSEAQVNYLFWPNGHWNDHRTMKALVKKGLVAGSGRLTNQGRQARAYLQEQSNDTN